MGFPGRSHELTQLDTIGGQSASVVVSGSGGVGKTALAVALGAPDDRPVPDGQLYVNLHGFSPCGHEMEPAEAVRGFLDAFGVAPDILPSTLDVQVGLYRSLVAGKRVLVVLDNAQDAEQVRCSAPPAHWP